MFVNYEQQADYGAYKGEIVRVFGTIEVPEGQSGGIQLTLTEEGYYNIIVKSLVLTTTDTTLSNSVSCLVELRGTPLVGNPQLNYTPFNANLSLTNTFGVSLKGTEQGETLTSGNIHYVNPSSPYIIKLDEKPTFFVKNVGAPVYITYLFNPLVGSGGDNVSVFCEHEIRKINP